MMQEPASLRRLLKSSTRDDILAAVASLSQADAAVLLYDWEIWARDNQRPPDTPWNVWLILAGRGFGKTRTGAEFVKRRVREGAGHIALVGRTAADVRDVMVQGESGLLAVYPKADRPIYNASRRCVEWPNGAIALCFSADTPDQLRGPQHDTAWADELASWQYPDAWDQLQFGLRLGQDPRVVVTTTPRPTKIIKDLVSDPLTAVVRGSTFDNRANLAPAFFDSILKKYEGTRLGRQELYAEILDDNPDALWQRHTIENSRLKKMPWDAIRIVVAIDPAATSTTDSDETGIVVAAEGPSDEYFVLEDASCKATPNEWAKSAIDLYDRYKADAIVAETNNGGEMIEAVLRNVRSTIPYRGVHASRGKRTRAEPIAALYEQGRVHHIGVFPDLEDQMCEWMPGDKSPDKMDALVWALTYLSTQKKAKTVGGKPAGW